MNESAYGFKRPNFTRFNPTVNGALHIGHLYMMLVNEAEAHESGGQFTVRFDDNQVVYRYGLPWTGEFLTAEEIYDLKNEMVEDIIWCRVKVDRWTSQEAREQRIERFMRFLNKGMELPVKRCYTSQVNPEVRWMPFDGAYPYVPYLTAEKVLNDYLDGCNLIIRGEDLLDEWALYNYFADSWGLPIPRQVFLKRLRLVSEDNNPLDIRKKLGGKCINSYREQGWSPDELKAKLAEACLIDPTKPWLVENCKPEPAWNS
jgi:glutamyl/glutaminyl-tRNA synthetase